MRVHIICGTWTGDDRSSGAKRYVESLYKYLLKNDVGVTHYYPGPTRISTPKNWWRIFRQHARMDLSDIIVHANRPDELVPLILLRKKCKKVVTVHGDPKEAHRILEGRLSAWVYRRMERIAMKRVDAVIFVDSHTRDAYLRDYPRLRELPHSVIPVGVDAEIFHPMPYDPEVKADLLDGHEFLVGYVGRINPMKRVDRLINALPEEAALFSIGSREMEVPDGVRHLGTVPMGEVPRYLSMADVVCLPSDFEGMPTVVLESIATGTPVVVTDVGDAKKVIVEGVNGYVTDGSTEDLREKLVMASQLPNDGMPSTVSRYDWWLIAERIVEVYDGLDS